MAISLAHVVITPEDNLELYTWLASSPPNETILATLKMGHEIMTHIPHFHLTPENDPQIKLLQEENLNLVKQLDEEISKYQSIISDKNTKIKELDNALKSMISEFCEGELKKLKHALLEKEAEIKTLKNTNAAKGMIGENLIMDTLRRVFTSHDIQNVGKIAHECDIHMHDDHGNIIAFESKYKNNITKYDLDKFYSDMLGFDQNVIAGVFISINTRNIPGKGHMRIEKLEKPTTDQIVPILFVGFDHQAHFLEHFPEMIKMFMNIVSLFQELCPEQEDTLTPQIDTDELFEHIQQTIDRLMSNMGKMADFKQHTQRFIADMEEQNKSITANLLTLLTKHGKTQTTNRSKSSRTIYTCEKCNKEVFTNKKHLARHMKSCGS